MSNRAQPAWSPERPADHERHSRARQLRRQCPSCSSLEHWLIDSGDIAVLVLNGDDPQPDRARRFWRQAMVVATAAEWLFVRPPATVMVPARTPAPLAPGAAIGQ